MMKNTTEITGAVLQRRDEWQQARTARRRKLTRCAAMLAVVLALCGGAAAANSNALADFFTRHYGGSLSREQEVVTALAEGIETKRAVSGDWAVTVGNTVCDGRNYYLTIAVTGPEGWMADSDGIFWDAVKVFRDGQPYPYESMRTWRQLELAEGDTDHYVMCLTFREPTANDLTLQLGDRELPEAGLVFEELHFVSAGAPAELLAQPVTIQTKNSLDEGTCTVRLDSAELRAFSLHVAFSGMDPAGLPDPEGVLVLKDGTNCELHFSGSSNGAEGTLEAVFRFPVLPAEVECILLEGIRLDIP